MCRDKIPLLLDSVSRVTILKRLVKVGGIKVTFMISSFSSATWQTHAKLWGTVIEHPQSSNVKMIFPFWLKIQSFLKFQTKTFQFTKKGALTGQFSNNFEILKVSLFFIRTPFISLSSITYCISIQSCILSKESFDLHYQPNESFLYEMLHWSEMN